MMNDQKEKPSKKKYLVTDEKYITPYEKGRVKRLKEMIPQGSQNSLALDLGCGSGFFSQMLVEKGWRVIALDAEVENIEAAMRYAICGLVGLLPNALDALKDKSFQLTLALELIEHLSRGDGKILLEKIWGLTTEGGQLVISTPNRYSMEGLVGYLWEEKFRKKGKWQAWDRTHQTIYSSSEFVALLRHTGWRVTKVVGYWYKAALPLGIRLSLPITYGRVFPLNKLGFNLIVCCQKNTNIN